MLARTRRPASPVCMDACSRTHVHAHTCAHKHAHTCICSNMELLQAESACNRAPLALALLRGKAAARVCTHTRPPQHACTHACVGTCGGQLQAQHRVHLHPPHHSPHAHCCEDNR